MNTESSTRKVVLSIIIPVYNVEAYIRQCLDSIFTEENAVLPYEVIVVNDGTPDNSMAIVEQFAESHENLHVISQKNKGLSVARNTGLTMAQGEYVWFVDSDDWIEAHAIKTIILLTEQYPTIDIFTVPATWRYKDAKIDWVNLQIEENLIITGKTYQEKGYHMGAWMFVVRQSLLKENTITFYPGILHEDMLWCPEIMYVGKRIMLISKPCYCYRQRAGSIMDCIHIKSGYDIISVHRQLMKFMDEHVLDKDKHWFRMMSIERIPEAIHVVWHLRHTKEFRTFLNDTRDYRHDVLKNCLLSEKSVRGKIKFFVMLFPRINERFRLLKKR